eukprot:TRINITY_DN27789_c0_g1_i1.p1 TRINITY_DN27789_c0_g1~~TRINITY_DN27789_c0_g1_i1.p1  ORF type:complete len:137 (+),score=38.41 TRINITY_DN27789_c0_g1_i1:30-413(+)
MTPLKAAAERCQAVMVDFLIERPEISVEQQIEALELVGASFANDKDNYDVGMAYRYMERGMKLRWKGEVVEKVLGEPIAAYDNWRETRTVEEWKGLGSTVMQCTWRGSPSGRESLVVTIQRCHIRLF